MFLTFIICHTYCVNMNYLLLQQVQLYHIISTYKVNAVSMFQCNICSQQTCILSTPTKCMNIRSVCTLIQESCVLARSSEQLC